MTDDLLRRALRASVFFNLVGALLFAFPDSLGRLAGFPAPAPHVYTAFIAAMVVLFAGTYGWLARQPEIDRPLVAFAALGKTSFFVVVTACWLLGEVPGRAVLGASGDLVFAALFAWWLAGRAAAPASVGLRVAGQSAASRPRG